MALFVHFNIGGVLYEKNEPVFSNEFDGAVLAMWLRRWLVSEHVDQPIIKMILDQFAGIVVHIDANCTLMEFTVNIHESNCIVTVNMPHKLVKTKRQEN